MPTGTPEEQQKRHEALVAWLILCTPKNGLRLADLAVLMTDDMRELGILTNDFPPY